MRKQGFIAIQYLLLLSIFITCLTDSFLFAKNNKKPSTIEKKTLFGEWKDEKDDEGNLN